MKRAFHATKMSIFIFISTSLLPSCLILESVLFITSDRMSSTMLRSSRPLASAFSQQRKPILSRSVMARKSMVSRSLQQQKRTGVIMQGLVSTMYGPMILLFLKNSTEISAVISHMHACTCPQFATAPPQSIHMLEIILDACDVSTDQCMNIRILV